MQVLWKSAKAKKLNWFIDIHCHLDLSSVVHTVQHLAFDSITSHVSVKCMRPVLVFQHDSTRVIKLMTCAIAEILGEDE